MSVQIKPLKWQDHSDAVSTMQCTVGQVGEPYHVFCENLMFFAYSGNREVARALSMDAAKAAAQTDYETRIFSALISSPGKDGGQEVDAVSDAIDALVERAEVEWSYHEDNHRYPRDFWHARISFLGYQDSWKPYGEQEQRELPESVKLEAETNLRDELRAALHDSFAVSASSTQPASTALVERLGWKLVPLVPTQEMIDAWRMDQAQGRSLQSSYSAMIAAEAELDSRTRELDKTEIELRALVDALTEAEPYVELCHSLMTQKETRANVWRVLKQVRSALKAESPSSDRAASEGWQPIETARISNGSDPFLAHISGHGCSVCYKGAGGFIYSGSSGKRINRATHWRPLPAPPAITEAKGSGQ